MRGRGGKTRLAPRRGAPPMGLVAGSGAGSPPPPGGAPSGSERERSVFQGWMRKKGPSRRGWSSSTVTRRWFVLTTTHLSYYASQLATRAKGKVALSDVQSLSLSKDASAPKHAIDLAVRRTASASRVFVIAPGA